MKKFGLLFIVVFALGALLVMLLWNALLPTILGLVTVNYWQAAGLLLLSRILLGGFMNPFKHMGGGGFMSPPYSDAKHREFHRKMRNMTREERLEFIRKRWSEECKENEQPQ